MRAKKEIAREVIQYSRNKRSEVRFATEACFRQLVGSVYKPRNQLLFWHCFDLGENIRAQLQLVKTDCTRMLNPDTNEPEYRVNFRPEILKRSRRSRSEITNYPETVELLDKILPELEDDELLFPLNYDAAKRMMQRTSKRSRAKCTPAGQSVTWKDLRSGMACDLISKRWTVDEVKARLGHAPSSSMVDKYVNFLAVSRHSPKKKVQQFEISKLRQELEQVKANAQLLARRTCV